MLFILGLIIGSFLNVLIYRIPRGQAFVLGRSHCTHCNHELESRDLIPLVSYLMLGGRCRYCKKPISPQYPLIELASGLIFAFAPSIFYIVVLELLLIIAVIDYLHLIIPDSFLVLLCIASLAMYRLNLFSWSYFGSALGFGGFFLLLWLVSRGKWVGFGDVKFAAALGLVFGFPGSLLAIYSAVLLGGALSLLLLVSRRATLKTKIPFGSLLAIGSGVYIFLSAPLLALLHRVIY